MFRCEALMGRALAWFAEQPESELRYVRGRTFYWAERWSDADTLLAALIADEPDNIDYRGVRGVTLAHLGRREEAREIDAWLAQLDPWFLDGAHTRWRAAIAAALGNREEAVRLLQQAYGEGMELGYYFRRDPEWRPLYDYGPYQGDRPHSRPPATHHANSPTPARSAQTLEVQRYDCLGPKPRCHTRAINARGIVGVPGCAIERSDITVHPGFASKFRPLCTFDSTGECRNATPSGCTAPIPRGMLGMGGFKFLS